MSTRIGNTVVPASILNQHVILLGKTRSGKSSTLRVLVEHCLDHGKRVCIVDPKGDWWGLKSMYPVVIFGGKRGDAPVNRHAGRSIAEAISTSDTPCIVDLSDMSQSDRTWFSVDFAQELFRSATGNDLKLVIDEVHNFAPQGKVLDPQSGQMLHWFNRLASEAAGKGIILLTASQRPQKVHKDFLTCCETLIGLRVIHPLDRKAIAEWIDGCADRELASTVLNGLAELPRGKGWVWSPEIKFGPELVQFPMFKSFDSFAAAPNKTIKMVPVDLEAVKAKMDTLFAEAKANDPKELRKEIAELKKQLASKPDVDGKAEYARGHNDGHEKARKHYEWIIDNSARAAAEIRNAFIDNWQNLFVIPDKDGIHVGKITPGEWGKKFEALGKPTKTYVEVPRPYLTANQPSNSSLSTGEQAILNAVAARRHSGCDAQYLSVMTGYKRSSRDTYLARLAAKGYIEKRAGLIFVTDSGMDTADGQPVLKGKALLQHWIGKLPEGEKVIVEAVAKCGGEILKSSLAMGVGYKRSSLDTYLARLRSRYLITVDGGIVYLAKEFFE